MSNEFTPDMISLIDDNNQEHNFEIIDIIDDDRGKFYALSPTLDKQADLLIGNGEYIILQAIETDEEIEMLEPRDEKLLNELSNEFEERFNNMFED